MVNSRAASYTLEDFIEGLNLTGTANINGSGNALNNVTCGNNNDNIMLGPDANNTLAGGAGNNT